VHLAHPLGVRAFSYRRVKNDERDAGDLADLLRMGRLAEAWIAPAEVRGLRELTRYRVKLIGLRSNCKDQVHGVLAKLGIPVTHSDVFGPAASNGWTGWPSPALRGEGSLAAAAGQRAVCRDHHAQRGDRGPAGR
jgi:transposase